jgi:hypothetical protein
MQIVELERGRACEADQGTPSPPDRLERDSTERWWEVVDPRPFEEWKAVVLAGSPDRCPECGGPLTACDDTEDDLWSDLDAAGHWCEGEVVRRYCISAYELSWPDLRQGHPSTMGELLYERVVYREAVPTALDPPAHRPPRM